MLLLQSVEGESRLSGISNFKFYIIRIRIKAPTGADYDDDVDYEYSQGELDNHAGQMNPNNDAYWSSRDEYDARNAYWSSRGG
mmetsp:Transcript_28656/g.63092  ORF Transcript_28656/g.63092 Transcript_28656/m.63092 type:complete len:83 (+) Transcript_28656:2188-2436(+)